jgi:hypothetical protein
MQGLAEATTDESRRQHLDGARTTFATLNTEMRLHLAEEEATLPHIMRSHFTLAEYKKFEGKAIAASRPTAYFTIPWFLYGAPAEEEATFLSTVPWFIRGTYNKKWRPGFLRHQALVSSIYGDGTSPHLLAPLPACWCCA